MKLLVAVAGIATMLVAAAPAAAYPHHHHQQCKWVGHGHHKVKKCW
jgi:hypothetical protein